MKKAPIIISIAAPCHESWDKMTPVEQGRFCQNCQKTVTDFSMMSDKEIISIFSNPQKNICGRFHSEQLNREVSIPVNARRQPLMPFAAMLAALTVAIPSVQAKNKPAQIQLIPDTSFDPQPSDMVILTGTVKNSVDNSILQRAIVKIKGQAILSATDSCGNYELRIPENVAEKRFVLQVEYPGFRAHELFVQLKVKVATLDIQLDPDIKPITLMMGAAAVVVIDTIPNRRTPWGRFKYKVGQLFH